MAFWGIQLKPGNPFTLKSDEKDRRRLHISQATLATGSSKKTSLVQCNVGDMSPVLLCALLPDKTESLQLNLEFDEVQDVLFSVIGPRPVYLTGFHVGFGNHDHSGSYGMDIANSENEESTAQSDEDEYEDSFIDDDENLEVLPPSPISTDGVDYDVDKQRKKTKTNKRLKKRSQVVESDDESISWNLDSRSCIRSVYMSDSKDKFPVQSACKEKKAANNIVSESNACGDASNLKVDGPVRNRDPKRTMPKEKRNGAANKGKTFESDDESISLKLNTGRCIRCIYVSDSDDGVPISYVRKNKKAAKNIVSESNVCGDVSNLKADGTVGNDDPKRTVPKKKGKRTSNEEKIFEADAADYSNPDVKAEKSESKTNGIAVYQDPIVGNKIHVDPGTNKTTSKKNGKGVSNEVIIIEDDAADHSNPNHRVNKSEAKAKDIAIGQDLFVTNAIDVDPGTNSRRSNLLPSPELGLESGVKPKKKRKEHSKEEKIPEADTGADHMDQDLPVGKENVRMPSYKNVTGFSAGSLLVEEGPDKPKKKRRKREQEKKTPAENDLVPERKADENTFEKAAKKKKQKSKVQTNDVNMDVLLNGEKENSLNEVQEENVISGSSQARTFSNGLVIEDLESSKSDGKAAALGRKLKVQYTAKLKENGELIDSNGKAPYWFRLGDVDVMEGWNIGLDGMRVGEKRRLVVPPSLGNGSKGTAENVPPDSWVIYDVELLSVR